MANSIDTSLLLEKLASAAVGAMPGLLAPLRDFATLLPLTGAAKQVQIPILGTLPAIKVNAGDFEADTDSTITSQNATPVHLAEVVKVSFADLQSGALMDWLAGSALEKLAQEIQARCIALLVPENFATVFSTAPAASFGTADLAAGRAAVQSRRRALLLDGASLSGIADHLQLGADGRWTLPGFAAVHEIGTWPEGTAGAVLDPVALVAHVGPVIVPEGRNPSVREVNIPDLGIRVSALAWTQPGSRVVYASFECRLALAAGQTGAAALLRPAA